MGKIVVYRTHIEINDYSLGDCKFIEKRYSVWNKIYHRLDAKGRIYNPSLRKLYLPRYSDIIALERFFHCNAEENYDVDPIRRMEVPLGLKYAPRDEDQKKAIQFMLGSPPYQANKYKSMLSLNLNTGKGKSYCSIAAIAYLGYIPIIITSTSSCLQQWVSYFLDYTDIKKNEIYLISGSSSIAKLYSRDINKYKVFLATHSSIKSYGDKNGWENVHELFKYLGIGIKIYDEAHLDFDNMLQIDCFTNTNLTYYLTATLARSNADEDKIFQIYFQGVPAINLFHEDTDPHSAYIAIKYNSKPTPMDISSCNSPYGINRMAYINYVVQQENFHKILHIIVDISLRTPGKILWYVGTNWAIQYVRDWLYDNYPELIGQVGIFSSIIPKESRKDQLDKKIILSTTKSAGAAMDIKMLAKAINLAEPFKSRVLAQQTFGRTRMSDTSFIDLVDIGFQQCIKFYNYKKPVYMKYATDCKEIVLRQSELNERSDNIVDKRSQMTQPITFDDDRNHTNGELWYPVIFEENKDDIN